MPGGGGRIDSPNINAAVVATAPRVEADPDLSSLLKSELVERADAAGIETDGLTKAQLVEALEGA